MTAPLCIDLFSGLGGWTDGFLAAGYECVGFDIERHVYGDHQYPAQLVLQDVLTLHGAQFRDAAVIVASSPCQAYSYMAMPWSRAKQIARALRGEDEFPEKYNGYRTLSDLNALFEAPKRIQREAIAAAGRFIPMIQENVRGAIPWVGRSAWNFGSYHLWGDVPALMPVPHRAHKANPDGSAHGVGSWFAVADSKHRGASVNVSEGVKAGDRCRDKETGKWTTGWNVANARAFKASEARITERDGVSEEGRKIGGDWFAKGVSSSMRLYSSKSPARKAASAAIAKIPFALARHIAECYYPRAVSA